MNSVNWMLTRARDNTPAEKILNTVQQAHCLRCPKQIYFELGVGVSMNVPLKGSDCLQKRHFLFIYLPYRHSHRRVAQWPVKSSPKISLCNFLHRAAEFSTEFVCLGCVLGVLERQNRKNVLPTATT